MAERSRGMTGSGAAHQEAAMKSFRSASRIVFSLALLSAVCASTARGDTWDPYNLQYHYKPFGAWGPEFTAPNVGRMANVATGREPLNQHVARRMDTSQVSQTRFDDLNLLVSMPDGHWTKLDPKQTGSKACYLIERNDPTIVISLAGERVGTGKGDTSSLLLAESQAKMKKLPGCTIESGERQLSTNGIEGIVYGATVVDGESTTHYSIWVAAHHGYNYKLAVYGDQNDKAAVDEALLSFVRGIKHVQPTRIARGTMNSNQR
jgi:hypothetical protein